MNCYVDKKQDRGVEQSAVVGISDVSVSAIQMREYEQLIEELHADVVGLKQQIGDLQEESFEIKREKMALDSGMQDLLQRCRKLEEENQAVKVSLHVCVCVFCSGV